MRLLVVEDEPFIALDLEGLAITAGHHVVGVAETLLGAIHLATETRPDCALVDVNLRDGKTGPDVARRLSGSLGVVVGFITGSAEQVPEDFAGAVCVLEKPFSDPGVFELLRMLQARLAGGALTSSRLVRCCDSQRLPPPPFTPRA